MHEMGIARDILDIAITAAQKEEAARITRINVIAGELRGVIPLQLCFCFGILAEGTIAGGAQLNIESTKPQGKCRDCDHVFPINNFAYICPHCQSLNIQVQGGTELYIRDIEVE